MQEVWLQKDIECELVELAQQNVWPKWATHPAARGFLLILRQLTSASEPSSRDGAGAGAGAGTLPQPSLPRGAELEAEAKSDDSESS